MNRSRCPCKVALSFTVLVLAGCETASPPPTLQTVQRILSVSYPHGSRVIGGRESPDSASIWLITSSQPLPLPPGRESKSTQRSRQEDRRQGTPFPVSALSNLIAACGVSSNDISKFTADRGITHIGHIGNWQYTYREAPTERGWLTAVEIHSNQTSQTQDTRD